LTARSIAQHRRVEEILRYADKRSRILVRCLDESRSKKSRASKDHVRSHSRRMARHRMRTRMLHASKTRKLPVSKLSQQL
jgi:hypothetical protein